MDSKRSKTHKEELKIGKDSTIGVKRTLTNPRHKQQSVVKATRKTDPETKISQETQKHIQANYCYNLIVT